MCAAQSNPPATFGYTWGFADNTRTESVVEISPNINYTMPYLQLTDSGGITVQKDAKGAIAHTNKGVVRRMIVMNEPFPQTTAQRVITTGSGATTVTHHKKHDVLTNGIIDTKAQTVLTTASGKMHFMSPIGPLQLTAEECNEILAKRAMSAAQTQHATIATTTDGHHAGISVQVQKVIQGLEENDDSQTASSTHCKLEPVMSISPKLEFIEQPSSHEETIPKKERPYSCDECGKSFLLKHHLTTHARVHTGERPHVCVHCGKSFAHKHCLNTHLLLHSTDRPYQCNECKKSFTLKHHLLTHSRVHSRERPFVCQECGRSFPLKRHLVTHSKFHAGERPYVCDDCGESFAQKEHLVMHSRFHGSLNPFVCQDCGATFPRKFQLVNHGRIHGRVPHSCPICGKEFLQKRTLVAHTRLHTGDQPYPCTICGEGFRTKPELNQHNRQIHGGQSTASTATANTIVATNAIVANNQHPQHVQVHTSQHQQQQQQQQQTQTIQAQQQQQQQTVTVVTNTNNGLVTTIATPSSTPETARPQFACRECGSAFNSREALALHLRLHTGDKSLMTDLCALTAAIPGHFLNTNINQGTTVVAANPTVVSPTPVPVQIITSSGQVVSQAMAVQSTAQQPQQTVVQTVATPQQKPKTHFCSSCGKGFAAKHGLLQHNRRHTNGSCTLRTHVCECGKAFFQKNHLMLHQRQHLETKPNITPQTQNESQSTQENQENTLSAQQQAQQNQQASQQQAAQQQGQAQLSQQSQQSQAMTRELVINSQPVQVQVLQGNAPQIIKYEIMSHEPGQAIE
ncbi:zinc finger protein 182 isoform X4 [Lutzomyia longipalpis]|uniref:zinc finger protein 182 isoform X4 n=1 Tax=Lutzomyia longipalpis TaxID=7200 RepID=UPI002483EFBE|nr:zinc finger protein 182 isoform X4 [Lutzomyia longipalpis]